MPIGLAQRPETLERAAPSTDGLSSGGTAPVQAGAAGGDSQSVMFTKFRVRARDFRDSMMEYCVPPGLERDTEPYRRARLITGFGFVGFVFGCIYAAFYQIIGHVWGAMIIAVCSACFGAIPFILRASRSIRLPANLLILIFLLGFSALCSIEGGIRGHAIGWLATVPLCAFLLVPGSEAGVWCALSIACTAGFVIVDLYGLRLPLLYPERWHQLVSAAGYFGLTTFMSLLGLIFEGGRRRSFARMERAFESVSDFNVRLKRLDQEKNEFLGIAAHDLKNPLIVIMGFAEMITNGRNATLEGNRRDASYIIEASDRMINLITQLLDVNAIEQGRFTLEIEAFDLAMISEKVNASFATAAAKKQISVYSTGPLMPGIVLADPKATFRLLDNLLSNAIKYSPPGSDVFVRMRNAPDGVVWEVEDHGAGLTEADQAKLFQKFTKLSARPTAGESSTGLGLSIVKMLAEAMRGNVSCKSQKGVGSTFSLRLPSPPVGASEVQAAATSGSIVVD